MSPMFVPGPVDVDPEVLAAQTQAMLPHRSPEFEKIFRHASESARRLFGTQDRVFITASSGTGLQEAAVRNLARRRVLSCVNGAFSERWNEVARTNGKQAERLEFAWDQPVEPRAVYEALKAPLKAGVQDDPYEMITIVHNETSTGLQNPVAEIAAAARAASPGTLICVDAVSSLGGAALEMDVWGLDMVLTSSQKCLALPPGLALAAVSERAMAYAETVPQRGWYFDLLRLEKHRIKNSTPTTPAISLIYALERQLERIFQEGLGARYARHSAMAERVANWAVERGFELYAPPGYRSQTVTTLKNTLELDFTKLTSFLMERGMRIANGYGPLKGQTLRIAHMGETQMADIERLLEALDTYIEET